MRILLVGGSKSGKSSLAQEIAIKLANGGPKYYWATMKPVDREDDERIERHIADRAGLGFITLERGKGLLYGELPPDNAAVLFDSVTALLANEMFGAGFDPTAPERALCELLALSEKCAHFVCVADEVFRDGAVYDDMTEDYRMGLARVLRGLAKEFDASAEVSCGIPKFYKGGLPE
ncbi:MAG: bifunctional adenosylcobinamide kinase/adenosylcobinamide-phosphate guanylyltransferase [Clostridiales bacterium]|nr:bifunctional adenosylcobinamide kinase/adenosylcobinamide-phosphate guanylyltransferase [Clostridiales bacterium]